MIINGIKIPKPLFAAYDGCHKIYIPVKGRERGFVRRMEERGYEWPKDFCRIENAADLAALFVNSCSLRFIEQIRFTKTKDGWNEEFTVIIPQFAFVDDENLFDEEAAWNAFADERKPAPYKKPQDTWREVEAPA